MRKEGREKGTGPAVNEEEQGGSGQRFFFFFVFFFCVPPSRAITFQKTFHSFRLVSLPSLLDSSCCCSLRQRVEDVEARGHDAAVVGALWRPPSRRSSFEFEAMKIQKRRRRLASMKLLSFLVFFFFFFSLSLSFFSRGVTIICFNPRRTLNSD